MLLISNVHEITSTTGLSFCPSSALWQQLRSLLCACCHALKTHKNPAPVVEVIPCAFLTFKQISNKSKGFSYIEVLVAMFILAIAIVPAMQAIQSGIQGAGIYQSLTRQHYALIKRMEEVQADAYGNLLSSAQTAANKTTPTSYSDAAGQTERVLVFLALYDADADPFTLLDPNNDGDADLYTGDTSNLLWLRVALENSAQGMETLVSR